MLRQLLLLQLPKSHGNYTAANVSKAQCALRVEHVEEGGCHITFILKQDKRGQRHYNGRENYCAIMRNEPLMSHATWHQVKHGETANPWKTNMAKENVEMQSETLCKLGALYCDISRFCPVDCQQKARSCWIFVSVTNILRPVRLGRWLNHWILWLHWIFRSYFFGSGKAELPLIPESVVQWKGCFMRGWSQIDAPCWLEKTNGSVEVLLFTTTTGCDFRQGAPLRMNGWYLVISRNLHIRQLVCKIWRDTKRPSPHLIRCPI